MMSSMMSSINNDMVVRESSTLLSAGLAFHDALLQIGYAMVPFGPGASFSCRC